MDRLQAVEDSLALLHKKVDLLLEHEEWVRVTKQRLHAFGILSSDGKEPDLLDRLLSPPPPPPAVRLVRSERPLSRGAPLPPKKG